LVALLWLLGRRVGPLGLGAMAGSVGRVCLATAVMGGVVWWSVRGVDWTGAGTRPALMLRYAATVLLGGAVYALAGRLVGVEEVGDVWAALTRRVRRRRG